MAIELKLDCSAFVFALILKKFRKRANAMGHASDFRGTAYTAGQDKAKMDISMSIFANPSLRQSYIHSIMYAYSN